MRPSPRVVIPRPLTRLVPLAALLALSACGGPGNSSPSDNDATVVTDSGVATDTDVLPDAGADTNTQDTGEQLDTLDAPDSSEAPDTNDRDSELDSDTDPDTGPTCPDGVCADDEMCETCPEDCGACALPGDQGGPCLETLPTCNSDVLRCTDHVCQHCGDPDEQCCASSPSCRGGLFCDLGTCVSTQETCGGFGAACCEGSSCEQGLVCDEGACSDPCGRNGNVCCAGDACDVGLVCEAGTCTATCEGAAPPATRATGVCEGLSQRCEGTGWVEPDYAAIDSYVAEELSPDDCDELDNDCDGTADEGCACVPGETRPCGTSLGECRLGLQTCDADAAWGGCVGATRPSAEVCDGLDNDCDGRADNGLPPMPASLDQGVCAGRLQSCEEGRWVEPPDIRGPEICDLQDNDCDGLIDEDNPEGGASCDTGDEGVCAYGEERCGLGRLRCLPSTTPSDEICDGLDNDCDGAIDAADSDLASCECTPSETRTCGSGVGACVEGTETCASDNTWGGVCEGETSPVTEVCNGADDDCDGNVDDRLARPPATLHEGVCSGCRQVCSGDDGWADPIYGFNAVTGFNGCAQRQRVTLGGPAGSSCEELFECHTVSPPITRLGGATVYDCRCTLYQAVEDLCDGLDNDCDGATDEGSSPPGICASGELGICADGVYQCVDGGVVCEPLRSPEDEVCDGLDNDCDGLVDDADPDLEACDCTPGEVRACGSSTLGLCQLGEQVCQPDHTWGVVCEGVVRPMTEVCDGYDNDCDSLVDESDPSLGLDCDTGQPGVCALGRVMCRGGAVVCDRRVDPHPETCGDGLDNDCDGLIDSDDPDVPWPTADPGEPNENLDNIGYLPRHRLEPRTLYEAGTSIAYTGYAVDANFANGDAVDGYFLDFSRMSAADTFSCDVWADQFLEYDVGLGLRTPCDTYEGVACSVDGDAPASCCGAHLAAAATQPDGCTHSAWQSRWTVEPAAGPVRETVEISLDAPDSTGFWDSFPCSRGDMWGRISIRVRATNGSADRCDNAYSLRCRFE